MQDDNTTDFAFEGGHIFTNRHYPYLIMLQSMPMLKSMGRNVDLQYARVDVQGATRDLTTQGYCLRQISHVDTLDNINPSQIDDRISGMIRSVFKEDIHITRGSDVILTLIQYTLDNKVLHVDGGFFASSERSEGHYYSYQLTFYSLRNASFCFIILSLCSFKESGTVFGIPSRIRSGVAYGVQVLECKRIHTDVLYNFGRLQAGEAMCSRDGHHRAALHSDGNLSVDSHWQAGVARQGIPPYYLTMQDDANLVIYDAHDTAIWASGSRPGRFSTTPYRLELQNDGNLVVYDARNAPLWAIGV